MGTKVTFKVVTPQNIPSDITDGQLLFVHDVDSKIGQIYLDYGGARVCYTTEPGMNYIGIADEDPSKITTVDGIIKINGNNITPRLKDVVVYGKKEYMWRIERVKNDDDTYT